MKNQSELDLTINKLDSQIKNLIGYLNGIQKEVKKAKELQESPKPVSKASANKSKKILLKAEVKKILRISSDSSLQVMINQGEFPQGMKVGLRRVGWYEHEINDWLDKRDQERKK